MVIARVSALFALGRGGDIHGRAVFGHGAAADLHAEGGKGKAQRLVRERRSGVLGLNETAASERMAVVKKLRSGMVRP